MKFVKWMLILLVVFAGLCGLGYWGAAKFTASFTSSHLDQLASYWKRDFDHHKARIKADLELLVEAPIYTDLARIKNAEPVVRQYLTWDGDKSGSAPEGIEFENEKKISAFSDRHPLRNLTDKSWAAILEDPELESLKLSWLDDLNSYDHFNMATHPSHVQAIEQAKSANGLEKLSIASSLPYPNLKLFRAMATFRLAQLEQKGKFDEGAELYRHISHLIWTQNSLVSSMTAMSMLKFEHELEKANGSYPLPLIENERIEAMRGLSWLWAGTYRMVFVGDFVAPMKEFFTPETGACSGASEAFAGTPVTETFFAGHAPLEQDFTASFKRVRAFEEKLIRMCDLEAYRPLFESSPEGSEPLIVKDLNIFTMNSKFSGYSVPNPGRIPLVRRAAGSILMSVAIPGAFSVYNKREREPASN